MRWGGKAGIMALWASTKGSIIIPVPLCSTGVFDHKDLSEVWPFEVDTSFS